MFSNGHARLEVCGCQRANKRRLRWQHWDITRRFSATFVILVASLSAAGAATGLPAFPGAEGGGALAVGGRGGVVCKVTNLNDSGLGSLRSCIDMTGPRTVIFTVGGTIWLESPLRITNPYITIAGQTAPGGGIQIAGKNIQNDRNLIQLSSTNDVVIR